jgi:hypothetical protein
MTQALVDINTAIQYTAILGTRGRSKLCKHKTQHGVDAPTHLLRLEVCLFFIRLQLLLI